MNWKKNALALTLIVVLAVSGVTFVATDSEAKWDDPAGHHLSWMVFGDELQIYGSGFEMYDFGVDEAGITTAPWSEYAQEIKSLAYGFNDAVYTPQVRTIGDYSFAGLHNMSEMFYTTINPTDEVQLASIGDHAFENSGIKAIKPFFYQSPSELVNLRYIGDYAFANTQFEHLSRLAARAPNLEYLGEYAFSHCVKLQQVSLPGSLKELKEGTFKDCTSLKTVKFQSGLTHIGYKAFEGCTSLEKVVIPDGVTEIGKYAFKGCTSLKEVVIPGTVTKIEEGAFNGCSSLEKVTISDGVKIIGVSAFGGCTKLTDVTIPSTVTSIEGFAFLDCASLKNVVIPDSVSFIDMGVFDGCKSLENVKLPAGMKTISDRLFKGCSSLVFAFDGIETVGSDAFRDCGFVSISIPNSWKNLGDSVFEGCKSLKSVEIPVGIRTVADHMFKDCTSLQTVSLPEGLEAIGIGSFQGSGIAAIDIPGSVKAIGQHAFDGCASLKAPSFNAGLESIDDYAFSGCVSLESVDLPETLTNIGYKAFDGCGSLTAVNFLIVSDGWYWKGHANESFSDSMRIYSPYNLLKGMLDGGSVHYTYLTYGGDDGAGYWYIAKDALYIDKSLNGGDGKLPDYIVDVRPAWESDKRWNDVTNVVFTSEIASIGAYTFYDCDRIEQVIFNNMPESIGASAFCGCSGLREIMTTGNDTIKSIGESAFCLGKKESGVVTCNVYSDNDVLYGAFNDYKGDYTEFTYFDNTADGTIDYRIEGSKMILWKNEHADSGAMRDFDTDRPLWESDLKWKDVTEVEIGKGITHIGNYAFSGNKNLEKVTVTSEDIVSIGSNAFANCERMLFVMDGTGSLETIGDYTFHNCSKVTFDGKGINLKHARSLTTIGDYAFCRTAGSDDLCIYENVRTIGANAFAGLTELQSIYIYGDEWNIEFIGDGAISLKKFATIDVYSKDNFADHKLDQYSYCMFSYQGFSGSDSGQDEDTLSDARLIACIAAVVLALPLAAIMLRRRI